MYIVRSLYYLYIATDGLQCYTPPCEAANPARIKQDNTKNATNPRAPVKIEVFHSGDDQVPRRREIDEINVQWHKHVLSQPAIGIVGWISGIKWHDTMESMDFPSKHGDGSESLTQNWILWWVKWLLFPLFDYDPSGFIATFFQVLEYVCLKLQDASKWQLKDIWDTTENPGLTNCLSS